MPAGRGRTRRRFACSRKGRYDRQQFVAASQEDAERPERHGDAERRTIVALVGRLSFRTLQRRNAFRDALRRKKGRRSVPCC
ncbi:DUF1534 domain-containing protein [Pseudomonas syringae pv. tomato]|nr:DUF1534 domain-containing protein [Pseudomonas syringae]TES58816.1 DUF1534 domain-containing protein [Pseudomonas syringae pv. tomato]TES65506.1 DUF1534 domain-containing protein [Pseudomonas syringae pv. tomato]TES75097.1 DUF1534 domain-containing protein [Pseudomonas syringae pv. tomato]